MAKIFETQFEKGSYIDRISKTAGTLTNSPVFTRSEKGLGILLGGVDQFVHWGNHSAANFGTDNFSVEVIFKSNDLSASAIQRVTGKTTTTGWLIYITDVSGELKMGYGESGLNYKTFFGGYSLLDRKFHHIIVTWDRSGNATAYDNGALYGTASIAADAADNFDNIDDFEVGAAAGGFPFNGTITKVALYDNLLTAQERAQAYNEFLQAQPLAIEKYPRYNPHSKPTDLSNVPGLVAAYNMIPNNGTLVDISGNGNHHTVANGVQTVDGMYFDKANNGDGTTTPRYTLGTTYTIAFRIKLSETADTGGIISDGGTSDYIKLYNSSDQINHRGGAGTAVYWDSAIMPEGKLVDIVLSRSESAVTAYVNGVSLGNKTITGSFSYTGFANYDAFPFKGVVEDFKAYNYAFTQQEAKDYHNSFAKRVTLIEDFSLDSVGTAVPRGWIPGTGTYAVKELSSQDSVLKDLDVGTKYLECTSAGTIAIPSKAAYGTWEFDMYKGADGNTLILMFISNSTVPYQTGYQTGISSGESLSIYRRVGGVAQLQFATAVSYVANSIWYKMKITRTKDGEFYAYIKGGAFGADYTLIGVSSGANPVTENTNTESEYFVLDSGAGDRIANIKITEGVIQ